MTASIDYYFTAASPFAFLGHDALVDIASRHNKNVNFKPFNLMGVWANSGAVMPGERPAVRQRYRLLELQRAASQMKIALNPTPGNFPTNPTAADHCVCALVLAGENPGPFLRSVGEALWVHDKQIADEGVLGELLSQSGHDAQTILESANSDEAAALRQKHTEEAVAADAIGAPAYVYNGEVFWGQDRLEQLDAMITSGRPAFKSSL